jgi:hypothetical protein
MALTTRNQPRQQFLEWIGQSSFCLAATSLSLPLKKRTSNGKPGCSPTWTRRKSAKPNWWAVLLALVFLPPALRDQALEPCCKQAQTVQDRALAPVCRPIPRQCFPSVSRPLGQPLARNGQQKLATAKALEQFKTSALDIKGQWVKAKFLAEWTNYMALHYKGRVHN